LKVFDQFAFVKEPFALKNGIWKAGNKADDDSAAIPARVIEWIPLEARI
jgi:hypothetical protein